MTYSTTFLVSHKPLVKTYTTSDVQPYPLVSKVTSTKYEFAATDDGLRKKFEQVQRFAAHSGAMLKGHLTCELNNESRAGKTAKSKTNNIIIDIDGLHVDSLIEVRSEGIDKEYVTLLCEHLIKEYLPECFHNVSYIAHASASLGLKGTKVSMHLDFWLNQEIEPKVVKQLLRGINLNNQKLIPKLELTASGSALKWPVDPCLADNSRIVFIAPPKFENRDNPFTDDEDRLVLVEKANLAVNLDSLIMDDDYAPEALMKKEQDQIRRLRRLKGLSSNKRETTQKMRTSNGTMTVVTNPDAVDMEFHSEYDDYVCYNVNNGDSHAYYVKKDNPAFVHNFKGETPFVFEKANKEMYEWHLEEFGIQAAADGSSQEVPFVFRSMAHGSHFSVMYEPNEKRVHRIEPIGKQDIDDYMSYWGALVPDPIPQWDLVFDPKSSISMDFKNGIVNEFKEPKLLAEQADLDDRFLSVSHVGSYQLLTELCPTIAKLVYSMAGCGIEEIERFLNWLAYSIQKRDRTGTVWVFQGTQGTGKGMFFNRVLRPIFGEYTVQKQANDLEEQNNGWLEKALMVCIDEVKFNAGAAGKRIINKLKNMITEDHITIRKMRENQREARVYASFIMFTNEYDAVPLDTSDRRYNIAPAQTSKLYDRFPEMDNEKDKLADEVAAFATFLNNMIVAENMVKSPMQNEAKEIMREAALTPADDFAEALRIGNIDLLLDIMDSTEIADSQVMAAQNYLRRWIIDAYNERPSAIWVSDLLPVYSVLVSNMSHTNQLSRVLKSRGIELGRVMKDGTRKSGIEVQWHSVDNDIAALAAKYTQIDEVGAKRNELKQDTPEFLKNEQSGKTS